MSVYKGVGLLHILYVRSRSVWCIQWTSWHHDTSTLLTPLVCVMSVKAGNVDYCWYIDSWYQTGMYWLVDRLQYTVGTGDPVTWSIRVSTPSLHPPPSLSVIQLSCATMHGLVCNHWKVCDGTTTTTSWCKECLILSTIVSGSVI